MGTGDKFDPESAVPAPAGSCVIHYAGKVHYDGAKEEEIGGLLESTLPNRDGQRLVGGSGKAKMFDGRSGDPLPDEIEEYAFPDGGEAVHLPALLAEAFGVSRSEARRLLTQAGVKLDGEPLDGSELELPPERLDGAVIQLGKRRFKRLRRR